MPKKESIFRGLETFKKPISLTSRKHVSSKFRSHCGTPKMCILFLAKSVGYRDQKITLSLSILEKPIFKMFVFHFSICCDCNLFFPEPDLSVQKCFPWPLAGPSRSECSTDFVWNGTFYNLIIYLFLFWLKDPYSNYVTGIPIKIFRICEQQEVL